MKYYLNQISSSFCGFGHECTLLVFLPHYQFCDHIPPLWWLYYNAIVVLIVYSWGPTLNFCYRWSYFSSSSPPSLFFFFLHHPSTPHHHTTMIWRCSVIDLHHYSHYQVFSSNVSLSMSPKKNPKFIKEHEIFYSHPLSAFRK